MNNDRFPLRDHSNLMTAPGRGQVWTSEQLTARLAALRGLAPPVTQYVVYRATIHTAGNPVGHDHEGTFREDADPEDPGREGYLVPGETRRLPAAAFDFWLAKRGLAGIERLSVAVLVIRERLGDDGDIQDCELEYRRGAVDGPYFGSPARIAFTGPARLARFYQATPEGDLAEVAPTPGAVVQPRIESDTSAAIGLALLACCGEGARILDSREPTVIEAMVGITSVLHVVQAGSRPTAGPTAGGHTRYGHGQYGRAPGETVQDGQAPNDPAPDRLREWGPAEWGPGEDRLADGDGPSRIGSAAGAGDHREVSCGIIWYGPIAVALQAAFPRFDVEPTLSTGQSAALEALVAAEGLVACETRRDEHGLAVLTRRRSAGDLLLVRFDGETASLAPYAPGRPAGLTADQEQWLHYIETYEGLGVLDAYRDESSSALIVLTAGSDGAAWRHHVDIDGIETWRRADTGPAAGTLYYERTREDAALDIQSPPAREADQPDLTAAPFGDQVESRFPAMAYDIEEAATCLALRRPTAAVFHCQRIVEQGLRAHTRWRGPVPDAPTPAGRRWQAILSDLRAEGCDPDLFAAFDAVRRAWRGMALLAGAKYTEEEAARIMRLVEAFMRCLAGLCDEDGEPVQPDDASG